MLGRSRLTALSVDTNRGLGTNLVLPSLRDSVVEGIVLRTFGVRVGGSVWDSVDRARLVGKLLGAAAVTTAIIAIIVALSLELGLPLGATLAAALTTALLVRGAGNVLTGRLRVTDSAAIVDTKFLSHKRTVLSLKSVHIVTSVHFRRWIWLVTLHHYTGMARALRAVAVPTGELKRLRGT